MTKEIMIKIAFIIAVLTAGIGIPHIFKWKNENHVEEIAEAVIYHETGLDIDLTPHSPEGKELDDMEDEELKELLEEIDEWLLLEKAVEENITKDKQSD